jgi:hypothetical protein
MSQWAHLVDQPVKVVWRDAYFDFSRDGTGGDDREDYLVVTYGVLLSDGPTFFDVAAELLPDGDQRAVTHIPVENVKGCWPLGVHDGIDLGSSLTA